VADMELRKDDKGYYRTFTWLKKDGTAEDLTDLTITLKAWVEGSPGTLKINGECTVVSATAGTCKYLVLAADTAATAAEWHAELEGTATGVIKNSLPFTISVTESG